MRYIVYGDSISEGYSDFEYGGWVNKLKIDYMREYMCNRMVMNYGISAYTSTHLVNCFHSFFDAVSRRQIGKEKESTVIIAIGINDSATDLSTGKNQVDIVQFEENLRTLIQKCKTVELIKKIVFLGNINIDESVINVGDDADYYFFNSDIQLYNTVIQKIAQEHSVGFIDLFGLMNHGDLKDGLHPNAQGHEKIYKVVKEFLK